MVEILLKWEAKKRTPFGIYVMLFTVRWHSVNLLCCNTIASFTGKAQGSYNNTGSNELPSPIICQYSNGHETQNT